MVPGGLAGWTNGVEGGDSQSADLASRPRSPLACLTLWIPGWAQTSGMNLSGGELGELQLPRAQVMGRQPQMGATSLR